MFTNFHYYFIHFLYFLYFLSCLFGGVMNVVEETYDLDEMYWSDIIALPLVFVMGVLLGPIISYFYFRDWYADDEDKSDDFVDF
jgi:hypothetical protein